MTTRQLIGVCTVLLLVLGPGPYAAAVPIDVLGAQYTTTVSTERFWDPVVPAAPRTIVSSTPLRDDLVMVDPNSARYGPPEAEAVADLFMVQAYTHGIPSWNAQAFATTAVTFSPLVSALAPLTVSIIGWYEYFYSAGDVRLLDQTAGRPVWEIAWADSPGMYEALGPTHPWVQAYTLPPDDPRLAGYPTPTDPRLTARPDIFGALTTDTPLLAGRIYELDLSVATFANEDPERVRITVSGLEPVPEPSTLLLLGSGLAGLGVVGYRRHRRG